MKIDKMLMASAMMMVALAIMIAVPVADESFAEADPEPITEIKTLDDLKAFRQAVNDGNTYAGEVVSLLADIDLNGEEWSPIGGESIYFAGEFDGNGHVISNLKQTTGARMGFFGLVEKSYIHDLKFEDVSFTVDSNNSRVGTIAGNLQYWNVVKNVHIYGISITVNGNDGLVGCVAGYVWKSQMENVNVDDANIVINGTGNVIGGHTAYGRAHVWDTNVTSNNSHWLDGTVQIINGTEYVLQNYWVDCNVTDIVVEANGNGSEIGGFFGSDTYNSHSNYFVKCTVFGLDVECAEGTSQIVGGFIAWNNGTTTAGTVKGFTDCTASGKISGDKGIFGGFAGQVGGRASSFDGASADVDIVCEGTVGGFVGATQAYSTHLYVFDDCVANGDVEGDIAGGFAGGCGLSGDGKNVFVTITGCTASGEVHGTSVAGGFIGDVNTELPATNWNTVDGFGKLTVDSCTIGTTVACEDENKKGSIIGYLDAVCNGDCKEGNYLVPIITNNTVMSGSDEVNYSEDTHIFSEEDVYKHCIDRECTICGETISALTPHVFATGGICDENECSVCGTPDVHTMDSDGITCTRCNAVDIMDKIDLFEFAKQVNNGNTFSGKIVRLMNNINLEGEKWIPIGGVNPNYFAGEFDGREHSISNMIIDNTDGSLTALGFFGNAGLFTYIHDVTFDGAEITTNVDGNVVGVVLAVCEAIGLVEDVTVKNSRITINCDNTITGIVVGHQIYTQMNNVRAIDSFIDVIGSNNKIGGAIGTIYGYRFTNAALMSKFQWIDGSIQTVNGTKYLILGFNKDCIVENVDIDIGIDGDKNIVGGFVANDSAEPNIYHDCFVDCVVTDMDIQSEGSDNIIGGFIGLNDGLTQYGDMLSFDGCSATGSITGETGVFGGFVGIVGGYGKTYSESSAKVDISCDGTVGGFVGRVHQYGENSFGFVGCGFEGDISGNVAGGFVGDYVIGTDGIRMDLTIKDCSSEGTVKGATYASGFIGALDMTNGNESHMVSGIGTLRIEGCVANVTISTTNGLKASLIGYCDPKENTYAADGHGLELILSDNVLVPGIMAINVTKDTKDNGYILIHDVLFFHEDAEKPCIDRLCIICDTVIKASKSHVDSAPEMTCIDRDCKICGSKGVVTHTTSHKPLDLEKDMDCIDRTCSICKVHVFKATGEHQFEDTDATCINRTCIKCHGTTEGDGVHKFDVSVENKPCIDRKCTLCDDNIVASEDHIDSNPTMTCIDRACKICGTMGLFDHTTGHMPSSDESEMDCKDRTCSICNDYTIIATDGHTFLEGQENTICIDRTCTVCNTLVKASSKHKHLEGEDSITCIDRDCSICGEMRFPATTGHIPSEEEKDMSCKDRTCSICKEYTIESTSDHRFEDMDATCIDRTCLVCSEVTVHTTDHEYALDENDNSVCTLCGEVLEKEGENHVSVSYVAIAMVTLLAGSLLLIGRSGL